MAEADPSLTEAVSGMLRAAVADVIGSEAAALADEPDGVHGHRTRVRRLRSILAFLRDDLDAAATRRLRVAFREWGRQLGAVRDAEVAAADAERTMAEAGIVDPAMRRRMVEAPASEYRSLHARLVRLRQQPRSEVRLSELRAFAAAPVSVEGDATEVLGSHLRREARRVKRAAKRLDGSMGRYHDLRKAGRRLRYAAEAVAASGPVALHGTAEALAKAGEQLHDLLGDHRDAVALVDRLERTSSRAARAGEATEGYELAAKVARERAEECLAAVPSALGRVASAASALS